MGDCDLKTVMDVCKRSAKVGCKIAFTQEKIRHGVIADYLLEIPLS